MLTAPTRRSLLLGALAGIGVLVALTPRMQTEPPLAITATAEAPQAAANLNGVPSLAVLPDGGTMSLDTQSPTEVDAGVLQLDAAIAPIPAATPSQSLIFTLDFSRSTFDDAAGCGGDFNLDGNTDRVLDCELAAAWDTIQRAGEWGVAEAGVDIFETIGASADLQPQTGRQRLTPPTADLNHDGVADLETVLHSAYQAPGTFGTIVRGVRLFSNTTVTSILGGGTNYREAARETCRILTFSTQPDRTVLWLSDGEANFGGTVNTQLPCATPATIYTVAVGAGPSCTTDPKGYGSLQHIADLAGGTCTQVTDPSELADVLDGLLLPGIDRVNGGAEVDVSDSVDATEEPASRCTTPTTSRRGRAGGASCATPGGRPTRAPSGRAADGSLFTTPAGSTALTTIPTSPSPTIRGIRASLCPGRRAPTIIGTNLDEHTFGPDLRGDRRV